MKIIANILASTLFFFLFIWQVKAQGIMKVPTGAFLKVSGSAFIKLNDSNLDISGSFSTGAGTVEFQGSGTGGIITGTQLVVFNHLLINCPGQIVQLNQDIRVDSNVIFTAGMLELNGNDLTLGQPNGLLINETESSHITGASGGEVILTTSLNNPNQSNPGNIGVVITSSSNLGTTIIRRGHTPIVLPALGNSVNRYFDIIPANNTNLDAILRFTYFQSEVNGLLETNLNLFRQNGTVWETGSLLGPGMQTKDANQNWVEVPSLAHLSISRLAECPPLSLNISGAPALCTGSSATLDAGTGFTNYLWSTNETSQTISVGTAGIFTVTVTNASGCTGTDSHVIIQNPAALPTISGPTSFCTGNSATLDAGAGFTNYLWSTNETSQTISFSEGGTYAVTVTNASGCTGTDSHDIMKNPAAMTVISGPTSFCTGSSATLDAGTGFTNYLWSTNETSQTINVTVAGTYTVSVTNSSNCTGLASVQITEVNDLSPSISGPTSFCPGESIQLDAGVNFDQYSWSNLSTTRMIEVDSAGTYTVTVSNNSGCSGTASVQITSNPAVSANIVPPGTLDCSTSQVTLMATGAGFSYQWGTLAGNIVGSTNTANAIVNKGGEYYLIATSITTGCRDSAVVIISQTGVPVSGIDLDLIDVSCFGNMDGQISVVGVDIGTAPFQYAIGLSGVFQNDITFGQLGSGTYVIQVKGADGCTTQQSGTLDAPDSLIINIPQPEQVQEGQSVSLETVISGGLTPFLFNWEGPLLSCTDCQTPTTNPLFTSLYKLTVTDAGGCMAESSVLVSVNSLSGTDIITPGDNDGLNDTLTFSELDSDPEKYAKNDIIIFNRWGQTVYKAAPYQNEWNGVNQNGAELPEGTYYYVLLLRDGLKSVIHGNVLIIR